MTVLADAFGSVTDPIADRLKDWVTSPRSAAVLTRRAILSVAFFAAVQLIFHLSLGEVVSGLSMGGLFGIIGVGLVLCFRTSRIINFEVAAIGAVPGATSRAAHSRPPSRAG